MDNRIRELRKAQGLTLQELAERVNSSNQQISQLESGRRRLNVDWLESLSVALGCHPMELLYDKAMAKTEQEEAMLELFRGLSAEQRDAFLKATTALAQPARLIDDSEEVG